MTGSDILKHCEIVNFREAFSEHSDKYDIAFVEGSINRPHDEERVRRIRANAKVLVAYGACATIGGVNGLRKKNFPLRGYPNSVSRTRSRAGCGEPKPVDPC